MTEAQTSLRSRTRALARAEIRAAAVRLFDRQGFDATTVGRIAGEAGVSQSSVFRYFPAKEDLVLDEPADYPDRLRETLERRPAAEQAWDALRETLRARTAKWQENPEETGRVLRILAGSESLRARQRHVIAGWQATLVPETQRRLGRRDRYARLRADAVVATVFACLDSAFREWQHGGRTASLDDLFDAALGAVTPGPEGERTCAR